MERFLPSDLVFLMWKQDEKINFFHLGHYPESGLARTACGMYVFPERPPSVATLEKPTAIPCCTTCAGRSKAFSAKYFGKRRLLDSSKRIAAKQKSVSDGMAQALHTEERKPGELF